MQRTQGAHLLQPLRGVVFAGRKALLRLHPEIENAHDETEKDEVARRPAHPSCANWVVLLQQPKYAFVDRAVDVQKLLSVFLIMHRIVRLRTARERHLCARRAADQQSVILAAIAVCNDNSCRIVCSANTKAGRG